MSSKIRTTPLGSLKATLTFDKEELTERWLASQNLLLQERTFRCQEIRMQGLVKAIKSYQDKFQYMLLGHGRVTYHQTIQDNQNALMITEASKMHHKGLENMTVAEVLMTKEGEKVGSWLWCRMDDTVYDAVKQMAQNNIGSLVVLKPGNNQLIAGIVTERDYVRKVIAQDKSYRYTKVGEIMTKQNDLITVTSDTNILHAMQLMTENHIRHVPVIDGKIVGMVSTVDVVRAVVEQQNGDMKRLNEYIRGEYN